MTPQLGPGASRRAVGLGPGRRRERTTDAAASATPAGSGVAGVGAPSAPPVDPNAPVRFAVDLFDVDESTIAPGSVAAIEALGAVAGAIRGTGASASPGSGGAPRDRARPPATSCGSRSCCSSCIGLCVEWAVYHRDALIRLRRGFGARFGRQAPDGGT